MSPAPQEEDLFNQALDVPPEERAAWLARLQGDNPSLHARLVALLQNHDSDPAFMADPVAWQAAPGAPGEVPIPAGDAGTRLGPYTLAEKLGEGGCGIVYRAEQQHPIRRDVALKVIKLGMDTRAVLGRFEAERQALARMDHPAIARVLDAGATPLGRPFFVMELVRGTRITTYCDQARLPLRARIELFIELCHGVQHAHQKGIIHRDLKPSNVLVATVNGRPLPKIIDFGVAKAVEGRLTDETLHTAAGQFLGTPAYMSPEQAAPGELDVDTRSDVFSLGALLYELLAGRPPHDAMTLAQHDFEEVRRVIREVPPPRPSARVASLATAERNAIAHARRAEPAALARVLGGDLDSIALQALAKERNRRYDSPAALADDLSRHLARQPVSARPPSRAYVAGRWIRRHRLAFLAGSAVAVTLAGGLAGATYLFVRERAAMRQAQAADAERTLALATALEQRALAESHARQAEQEAAASRAVTRFLEEDLLATASPGKEPDRDIKLRVVLDRAARRIEQRFAEQPAIEAAVRSTLGSTYYALGEFGEARHHWERALALREDTAGLVHRHTLGIVGRLLDCHRWLATYAEGEALAQRFVTQLEAPDGSTAAELIALRRKLGPLYLAQGRHADLLRLRQELLEASRRTHGPEHPATLSALSDLAYAHHRGQRDPPTAAQYYEEAVRLMDRILGPDHPETLATVAHLAPVYHDLVRYDEAAALHERVWTARQRALGPEHPDTLQALSNLAYVRKSQGRLDEAVALQQEVVELKERVLGRNHPSTMQSASWLAAARAAKGNRSGALALSQGLFEEKLRQFGPDHHDTLAAQANLAAAYRDAGRLADAEPLFARIVEARRKAFGDGHSQTLDAQERHAYVLVGLKRFDEARTLRHAVIEGRQRTVGPGHRLTIIARNRLAGDARSAGQLAEAVAQFRATLELARASLGPDHAETLATIGWLARALLEQKDYPAVEALLRPLINDSDRNAARPWPSYHHQSQLGEALLRQDRLDEAEPLLLAAHAGLAAAGGKIPFDQRSVLRDAARRLADLYRARNAPDLAARWQRTASEASTSRGKSPAGGR